MNFGGSNLLVVLVAIIVSLVLHEFMHGYVGYLLGDTTAYDEGRLSLNPMRHIDPFMTVLLPIITIFAFGVPVLAAKPVPFNPDRVKFDDYGAALLAAAGPLTNFVLAFICALAAAHAFAGNPVFLDNMKIFVELNVALFVFNLVPIPPLDGSRVLFAFAPEWLRDIMRSIEPYGLFVIFALVLLGGLGGLLTHLDQAVLNWLPQA